MSDSEDYRDELESNLSSLEGSQEEEATPSPKSPSKSKKKGKGKKDDGFSLKNALKVPRATSYSTEALHKQIHVEDIILDPDYQRDVVWTEEKQINLIDSILMNFYVPPIIFSVVTHEDGSEKRICIDGKQRLTSIQKFMDGLIPHRDPKTRKTFWYRLIDSTADTKNRKLLPQKYRQVFANKQIVCVEYQDITDSAERDIFQRVQLGVALTPAEKLRVAATDRSVFIRELVSDYANDPDVGLGSDDIFRWDRRRGADFRCFSSVVWMMYQSTAVKVLPSLSQVEGWLKDQTKLDKEFRDKVTNTFDMMQELLQGPDQYRKTWVSRKKLAPVELICILYLISRLRDHGKYNLEQTGEIIEDLRSEVRVSFQDIRMNNKVSAWLLEWIKKVVSSSKGQYFEKKRKKRSGLKTEDVDPLNLDEEEEKSPPAKRRAVSKSSTSTRISHPSASPVIRQVETVTSPASSPGSIKGLSALRQAKANRMLPSFTDTNPQRLPSPQSKG